MKHVDIAAEWERIILEWITAFLAEGQIIE